MLARDERPLCNALVLWHIALRRGPRDVERALEGGEQTLSAWPWRLPGQAAIRGGERTDEEPDVLGAQVGLEQLHDAGDSVLAQQPNVGLLSDRPQE